MILRIKVQLTFYNFELSLKHDPWRKKTCDSVHIVSPRYIPGQGTSLSVKHVAKIHRYSFQFQFKCVLSTLIQARGSILFWMHQEFKIYVRRCKLGYFFKVVLEIFSTLLICKFPLSAVLVFLSIVAFGFYGIILFLPLNLVAIYTTEVLVDRYSFVSLQSMKSL